MATADVDSPRSRLCSSFVDSAVAMTDEAKSAVRRKDFIVDFICCIVVIVALLYFVAVVIVVAAGL